MVPSLARSSKSGSKGGRESYILRLPIPFRPQVFLAFSVLIGFNVAMVVPSPGAVGTVEAGGTAALVFFGVDQSRALAFMFVYHFTQLLPGIASGVAILVAEGERLFGAPAGEVATPPETAR